MKKIATIISILMYFIILIPIVVLGKYIKLSWIGILLYILSCFYSANYSAGISLKFYKWFESHIK